MFCDEDWQLPLEVAGQLGPRFTEWQEQGTVEESWVECEEHARRMTELPVPLPEKNEEKRNGNKGGKALQEIPATLWEQ